MIRFPYCPRNAVDLDSYECPHWMKTGSTRVPENIRLRREITSSDPAKRTARIMTAPMVSTSDTKIGSYEIVFPLRGCGMEEPGRAGDTRSHRMFSVSTLFLVFAVWLTPNLGYASSWQYFRLGSKDDVQTQPVGGTAMMGGGSDLDEAFRWLCLKANGGDFLVLRAKNGTPT